MKTIETKADKAKGKGEKSLKQLTRELSRIMRTPISHCVWN